MQSNAAKQLEVTASPESGVVKCAAVRNEDIAPFMGLVHEEVAKILRRVPPSVQRDDVLSAGTCGLMDALRRTAPANRGAQFDWYARIRIRGAILDQLRSDDWLSRTSRARVKLQADEGGPREALVLSLDALREFCSWAPPSLDESPFEHAARASRRTALSRAIAELPARERTIVEMHYARGVPFKEIAAEMKVSEPRIAQLHARAVSLLRDLMKGSEE